MASELRMARTSARTLLGAVLAVSGALTGCPGGEVDPGRDAGTDAPVPGTDTGPMDDAPPLPVDAPGTDAPGADAGPTTPVWCPAVVDEGAPPTCATTPTEMVIAAGEISADTTWDCDHFYRLAGLVFVTGGTLTIEAGTRVVGDSGSALIVTRDARLEAEGHPSAPIVFTSSKTPGTRARGDWGGVVLLGRGAINLPGGENRIEGITGTDVRGTYGGGATPVATHDCGTLRYARIEYAGFEFSVDNELNGLTMGGCGSDTTVDHVQVHFGDDDGIEMFGGSADLRYVLLTGIADDSLDWDFGWNGRVQYMIVQQHSDAADNGIEADNSATAPTATPISDPTLFNVTMIGTNDTVTAMQRAMTLRRGTYGTLRNFIVQGFPAFGVRVDGAESDAAVGTGDLVLSNSLFFEVGGDGMTAFEAGTPELTAWTMAAAMNRVGTDPALGDPYDYAAPDFAPTMESVVTTGAATPPAGFDVQATYVGAIGPGCSDWTAGWTDFAAN